MRPSLAITLAVLSLWSSEAGARCCLPKATAAAPVLDLRSSPLIARPIGPDGHSSFGGITLAATPRQVASLGDGLGLAVSATTFIGRPLLVSLIAFCKDDRLVGKVDFDAAGRALRIMLNARFFIDGPIHVRDFADMLFKAYAVRPAKVDDDNCFRDVTCFTGTTGIGERFLLLDIGHELQLYVRPPRPPEASAGPD